MFNDPFGPLFDDDDEGRSARGMEDVMRHLNHFIEDHKMPIADAIEGILNILRPGTTESSFDVMPQFRAAMCVQDFREVADNVKGVWLTLFPWGIGFHFGFEPDYPPEAMSYEAKRAVIRSLCAVLQAGGMNATMTDKDRINVTRDDGKEQKIGIDAVVSEFRSEIDAELGPDAPVDERPIDPEERGQITDWLKRWMP